MGNKGCGCGCGTNDKTDKNKLLSESNDQLGENASEEYKSEEYANADTKSK